MILVIAAAQQRYEEQLGRILTPEEGDAFRTSVRAALKQTESMVPGDDPVELRPVRRMSFSERSHVAIGIKGGQLRSGAEIEASADVTLRAFGILVVVTLIVAAALAWA